jgi:hypothetical protein
MDSRFEMNLLVILLLGCEYRLAICAEVVQKGASVAVAKNVAKVAHNSR